MKGSRICTHISHDPVEADFNQVGNAPQAGAIQCHASGSGTGPPSRVASRPCVHRRGAGPNGWGPTGMARSEGDRASLTATAEEEGRETGEMR